MQQTTIAIPVVERTEIRHVAFDAGTGRLDVGVGSSGGFSAAIEAAWQLVVEGRGVVCASGDHGQSFGLPQPIDLARDAAAWLLGRMLVAARALEPTGDLELEFSGGLVLRALAVSSGFEAWSLTAGDGSEWVARGGGSVVRIGVSPV